MFQVWRVFDLAKMIKPKKAKEDDWEGLNRYWIDGILWSESEITRSARIEKSHLLLFNLKVPSWINKWIKDFGGKK